MDTAQIEITQRRLTGNGASAFACSEWNEFRRAIFTIGGDVLPSYEVIA